MIFIAGVQYLQMYSLAFSDGFLMSIKQPSTTPIVFRKPTKRKKLKFNFKCDKDALFPLKCPLIQHKFVEPFF